jgi:hypothetical protein
MCSDSYIENDIYDIPHSRMVQSLSKVRPTQTRAEIYLCLAKVPIQANSRRIHCFTNSTPKAQSQQPHPSRKNNHIQTPFQSNKKYVDTNLHRRRNLSIHLGCLGLVLLRAMSRGLCIRRGFGWGLLGRSRGCEGRRGRRGRGKTRRRLWGLSFLVESFWLWDVVRSLPVEVFFLDVGSVES